MDHLLSAEQFDRRKAKILLWCSILLTPAFYFINIADPDVHEYLFGRGVTVAFSIFIFCFFDKWWTLKNVRYWVANTLIGMHLWYSFVSANWSDWNAHYQMLWICEAAILSVSTFRFRDFVLISILSLLGPLIAVAMGEFSLAGALQLDAMIALILLIVGVTVRANCRYREEIVIRSIQSIQNSKMAALGQMAAGLAHEINNPLAIIRGLADRCAREVDTKKYTEEKLRLDLDKISSTTDRIAKIIRGLKAISRNSENDPMTPINLKQLIDNTMELCREKFNMHGVEFEVIGEVDIIVECREAQISQVLLNLFNNANDAISKLPEKWIHLNVSSNSETLVLRVVDSGLGIPSECVQRLTEPFFTTKDPGQGTGLGLSISHGLIGQHGGKFYYELFKGHTSFVIELPLNAKNSLKPAS